MGENGDDVFGTMKGVHVVVKTSSSSPSEHVACAAGDEKSSAEPATTAANPATAVRRRITLGSL